jgi:hypothetical protein
MIIKPQGALTVINVAAARSLRLTGKRKAVFLGPPGRQLAVGVGRLEQIGL